MKLLPLLVIGIFSIVVGSCEGGNASREFLWSQKPLSSGKLVWADQINRLYFKSSGYNGDLNKSKVVMVRISPGRYDPAYWQAKNNVLALTPPVALEYGRALVDIQSEQEHLELAKIGHDSGGCGNIESVNLNTTIQEGTTGITPTLFHERVKLDVVEGLLDDVDEDNIISTIQELEDKGTRHHTTTAGIAFPDDLVTIWTTAGTGASNFEVEKSEFSASDQDNVIARFTGTEDPDTVIIIGAHMDSINDSTGDQQDAPGADDDASGIATITEAIRVLAASDVSFSRTVEFHAYGAEEVGLFGSKALAAEYSLADTKVAGMFQIDMNAFSADGSSQTIFFTEEFTDSYLNRVNKELLQTYLGGDYEEKSLSAGTSDHKSWHNAGFPAVFPFEDPETGNFNAALHTPDDTLETINNTAKSARFAKLVLAYVSHHAGLTAAESEYNGLIDGTTPESADSKDLPLAVIDSTEDDEYYMAVGTTEDIARVEACKIGAADDITCTSYHADYEDLGAQQSRQIHLNTTVIPIADGERFRLYGYNSDDELTAVRNVKLDKK